MERNKESYRKREINPKKIQVLEEIDFDYILNHSDRNNFVIPQYYDKTAWNIGGNYRIRIGSIYDVSKFWIVHKEQELNLFQDYLNHFYNINGEALRIPREKLKKNYYCVAFVDGGYYRGLILNISYVGRASPKAMVFLFDYGYLAAANIQDLFYMNKNMFHIPQFSIRACLFGVEPFDTDTWTVKVRNRFNELTSNKVLLCFLEVTDPTRKIVFIKVAHLEQIYVLEDISTILIKEKLAKPTSLKKDLHYGKSNGKMTPKTKYPFLFPSFERIESGMLPSSVYVTELLKDCVTSFILFNAYYSYNGVDLGS